MRMEIEGVGRRQLPDPGAVEKEGVFFEQSVGKHMLFVCEFKIGFSPLNAFTLVISPLML